MQNIDNMTGESDVDKKYIYSEINEIQENIYKIKFCWKGKKSK